MSELGVTDEEVFASHRAFAATEYGELLAGRVRYERYRPEHISNEEWVDLLGADVNNLEHMPLTRGLARDFVRATNRLEPGRVSPEQGLLLDIAGLVHDRGESIITDITFSEKTEADELAEHATFAAHGNEWGEVSPAMKELTHRAVEEVVFAKTGELAAMFNAVENIGYVRTLLRASERLILTRDARLAGGLRWLVADVLQNAPMRLAEHAEAYLAVEQYLLKVGEQIHTAFGQPNPSGKDFENYGVKRGEKVRAFLSAWSQWENWEPLVRQNELKATG